VGLVEAFESAANALPFEREFRDVEIVSHRARRQGRSVELSLTVDRPGLPVDLALCERVAAHLNALLEAETAPYTLEVESAGLERPLVRPADYERFRERNVVVTTTLAVESEYTHRGKLLGVRGNAIVLERRAAEFLIPLEIVKVAKIEHDFRADLRRSKRESASSESATRESASSQSSKREKRKKR
jgi:ribosome maturation factor RimP